MKTIRVRTLKNHTYQGRAMRPGDEYDAVDDRTLIIVVAAQWATRITGRDATPPAPLVETQAPKDNGRYKRRDMRADR